MKANSLKNSKVCVVFSSNLVFIDFMFFWCRLGSVVYQKGDCYGQDQGVGFAEVAKEFGFFVRVFHSEPPVIATEGKGSTKARPKVDRNAVWLRLNGVHGHSRFLKGLLSMSHSGDFSYWEPHLKRRLIRLTHFVDGKGEHEGAAGRLMEQLVGSAAGKVFVGVEATAVGIPLTSAGSEEEAVEFFESLHELYEAVAEVLMEDVGVIMRRLADVDGRTASMLEYPHMVRDAAE